MVQRHTFAPPIPCPAGQTTTDLITPSSCSPGTLSATTNANLQTPPSSPLAPSPEWARPTDGRTLPQAAGLRPPAWRTKAQALPYFTFPRSRRERVCSAGIAIRWPGARTPAF
ncbi:hypothetical protein Q5752_003038 [Cryptotrichosporon argae]